MGEENGPPPVTTPATDFHLTEDQKRAIARIWRAALREAAERAEAERSSDTSSTST